jgi:RNA polymerase primary sigma factor
MTLKEFLDRLPADKLDRLLKNRLTYREREILKLLWGLGDGYTYTKEEIGRIFKITADRVVPIGKEATAKLKEYIREKRAQRKRNEE